jgi:hypothetical protein
MVLRETTTQMDGATKREMENSSLPKAIVQASVAKTPNEKNKLLSNTLRI